MAELFNVYKNKDVIAYAADMIVHINGVDDKYTLPINNKSSRLNFTDDITTCNIDLAVDNAGSGSATFSLAIPRHSQSQYFKYGRTVFKPMMEIEVYMKGRFLDQDHHPVYYQVFWGLITDVNVDYSGGQHTIEVTAVDILYFWSITRLNTKPSTSNISWDTSLQLTEYVSIFNHLTPFQIMLAMAYVLTGSLMPPSNSLIFGNPSYSRAIFASENRKAMQYWEIRNRAIGQRFRMFGLAGGSKGPNAIVGSIGEFTGQTKKDMIAKLEEMFPRQGTKIAKSTETTMNSATSVPKAPITLDGGLFDFYFPLNAASQSVDFGSGENQSKLEIAQQVAEFMNYEFFMDVTGEVIFKPPFYNLDVRANDPVSVIRDLDIVSFNVSETARELITRLDVYGAYTTYFEDGDKNSIPYGSFIDYRLAEEFGFKSEEITRSFLNSPQACSIYAISELSRYNSKRFSSSLTIVGRPELRLGYPVYVESMDTFFYVKGISHSYSATGKLETVLSLEGARRKYLAVSRETGKVVEGASWDLDDPFRPRLRGVPNVVLIGDVPDSIEELDVIAAAGELLNPVPAVKTETTATGQEGAATTPSTTNSSFLDFIKAHEGFRANAYPDPGYKWKVPTIGYGTTVYANGKRVQQGDRITQEQALAEVSAHLDKHVRPYLRKIPYFNEMSREQVGALESFGYNCGGAFYGNSKFAAITDALKKKDWQNMRQAFMKYVNSNGQRLQGLVKRRTEEADMWERGLKGGTPQSATSSTTVGSTAANTPTVFKVTTPEQYEKAARQFRAYLNSATYKPATESTMSVPAGTMRNDAYTRGLRRVASSYQGIELQSYGRTLEVIIKGVLHADNTRIPVSDEAGYEVIGGFGYGRGAMLDSSGKLVPTVTFTEKSIISFAEKPAPAAQEKNPPDKKEDPKDKDNKQPGSTDPQGGRARGKAAQEKTAKQNPSGTAEAKKTVTPPPFTDLVTSFNLEKDDYTIVNGSLIISDKLRAQVKNVEDLQQFLVATKLADKYQIATQILKIQGEPDPKNIVVKNGHSYDATDRDQVSRYLGSTTGEFQYSGAGFYLADLGGVSTFYSKDFETAMLAETTAAIEADNYLRNFNPVFDQTFETQVLSSKLDFMQDLGFENFNVKKETNPDPNNSTQSNPESPGGNGVDPGPASGTYTWPTDPKAIVVSFFGPRNVRVGSKNHKGIDISSGLPKVLATDNGKVTYAGPGQGYGQFIILSHSDGTKSRYGHLGHSSYKVKTGDGVSKGQHIADVGAGKVGTSSGPHLHFEIRPNDVPVDPLPLLKRPAENSSAPANTQKQSRR